MQKTLAALGRAALYILAYVGMQILVSFGFSVFGIGFFILSGGNGGIDEILEFLMQFLAQTAMLAMLISAVLTLGVYALVALVRKRSLSEHAVLTAPAESASLLAAIPFGFAANLLISFVISLLPQPLLDSYGEASSALASQEPGMIYFLASVLVVPFLEEVLFRGLVQNTLKRSMRLEFAVLVQALFFALMHTGIVWMAYAFVLGLALGILREAQRSLWPGFVLHAAFNGASFISMLLPELLANPLVYVLVLMLSAVAFILLGYALFIHTPAAKPETEPVPETDFYSAANQPGDDTQNGGN
ncbi:MAG: CPBP family intramembrane metalloprotease [Clostridia bacterium]|nr:CPBP family intramembrane metalloprotease [Clostridia bacterium]